MAGQPRHLEWSDRARRQLLEILDFYQENASTAVAERVLRQIEASALELTQHPNSGSPIEGLNPGYRRARAGSYVILYQALPQSAVVRVFSVRHARRRPLSRAEVALLIADEG